MWVYLFTWLVEYSVFGEVARTFRHDMYFASVFNASPYEFVKRLAAGTDADSIGPLHQREEMDSFKTDIFGSVAQILPFLQTAEIHNASVVIALRHMGNSSLFYFGNSDFDQGSYSSTLTGETRTTLVAQFSSWAQNNNQKIIVRICTLLLLSHTAVCH